LHAWLLRDAPKRLDLGHAADTAIQPTSSTKLQHEQAPPEVIKVHFKRAPFWLLAGFMLTTFSVSSALPAHMVSLLEEAHLSPAWVIAIPASIGVIQVLGRLLLFVFEKHLDVHAANKWIPCLVPLGLLFLVAGGLEPWAALMFVLFYGCSTLGFRFDVDPRGGLHGWPALAFRAGRFRGGLFVVGANQRSQIRRQQALNIGHFQVLALGQILHLIFSHFAHVEVLTVGVAQVKT